MNKNTTNTPDRLEDQEFFDLMQQYRIADPANQELVIQCFEKVKEYLRTSQPQASTQVHKSDEEVMEWFYEHDTDFQNDVLQEVDGGDVVEYLRKHYSDVFKKPTQVQERGYVPFNLKEDSTPGIIVREDLPGITFGTVNSQFDHLTPKVVECWNNYDKTILQLAHTGELLNKMKRIIEWWAAYGLTANDGGEAWCAVRNNPGAVEWIKEMKELVTIGAITDPKSSNQ